MNVSSAPRLTLGELLSESTILLSLRSKDRDGAFAELIDTIPALENRPEAKQSLLRALLARENLCTTALGNGIALPHTRNNIAGLDRVVIIFGRQRQGVAYGAAGREPVKLFFLLLAPTIGHHLQLLALLSRVLGHARLRQELLEAETEEEVLGAIREVEQELSQHQ